jgi:uncharacterized protein YdaU (DUF1376 family)
MRFLQLVRTIVVGAAREPVAVKGLPYVPWYHGDFLRSTAGWTLLERAAYWMLLCAQWETGPLPNDMSRLAAIAGIDTSTMTTMWTVVRKKFRTTAAGLVNRRMQERKRNYQQFRQRQVDGGRKGAKARWQKATNIVPFRASDGSHE